LAIFIRRYLQPGLTHHLDDPEGFQHDRLPARIRTGNDDGLIFFAKDQIIRDDGILVDERMSGFPDGDVILLADDRTGRFQGIGIARFGIDEIQSRQHFAVSIQFLREGFDFHRQFIQDPFDFRFFLGSQLAQMIIQVQDSLRLDIKRLTG